MNHHGKLSIFNNHFIKVPFLLILFYAVSVDPLICRQGELEPAADLGAEADAAGGRGPEEEEGDHRGRGGPGMAVGRCPAAEFSAA